MTACPPQVDLLELNARLRHMLSRHHRYRDYEGMVDSLVIQPKRKESELSEGSTIGELQTQVDEEFEKYMRGDTLSPLL